MNNTKGTELDSNGKHLENLQKRRTDFTEILVTAVLFGLAVNLVSDIVSSLTSSYGLYIGVGSAFFIFLLLGYLFWLQIAKYTRFEEKMIVSMMWDSALGKILKRETGYLPHLVLWTLFSNTQPTTKAQLTEVLKATPEEARNDSNILIRSLAEGVIFGILDRLSSIPGLSNTIDLEEDIPDENLLLVDKRKTLRFHVPENTSVDYQPKSKNKGELKIGWKWRALGSFRISFTPKKIDWYSDKKDREMVLDPFYLEEFAKYVKIIAESFPKVMPEIFPERELGDIKIGKRGNVVRADIEITMKFGFNSFLYYIRPSVMTNMYQWAVSLMKTMKEVLDWPEYLSRAFQIDQIQRSIRDSGFGAHF